MKRELHQGDGKYDRMHASEDRFKTSVRTRFLGEGGLRDYDGNLKIGMGFEESPYQTTGLFGSGWRPGPTLPEHTPTSEVMHFIHQAHDLKRAENERKFRDHHDLLRLKADTAERKGREDLSRRMQGSPLSILNAVERDYAVRESERRGQEMERVRRQQEQEIQGREAERTREHQLQVEKEAQNVEKELRTTRAEIVREREEAKGSTFAVRRKMHEDAAAAAQKRLPGLERKLSDLQHRAVVEAHAARSLEDEASRSAVWAQDKLDGHGEAGFETVLEKNRHHFPMTGFATVVSLTAEYDKFASEVEQAIAALDEDHDGQISRQEMRNAVQKSNAEIFDDLAQLAAQIIAFERKVGHSIASQVGFTLDSNINACRKVADDCAKLLKRLHEVREK